MDCCNNCNPGSSHTAGDNCVSTQFKQGAVQIMEAAANCISTLLILNKFKLKGTIFKKKKKNYHSFSNLFSKCDLIFRKTHDLSYTASDMDVINAMQSPQFQSGQN